MGLNYQQQYPSTLGVEVRSQVLRNTYLLLALSLLPTAMGALIGLNLSFMFLAKSPIMSMLILMAGMYFIMFMVQRNKYSFAGVVWLMAFTFLMGLLLGPLFQFTLRVPNGAQLIGLAAVMTSAIFLVMSGIAFTLKRETPFLTNFLTVGGVVLMIAVIANIFLQLPGLYLMICAAFVIFSSLMILWQTNQIVNGGETSYIAATLMLFLSLYNLFTSLLQLILAFTGNDRR